VGTMKAGWWREKTRQMNRSRSRDAERLIQVVRAFHETARSDITTLMSIISAQTERVHGEQQVLRQQCSCAVSSGQ
jgi:iron-sulfur cluster repair protein YtfE (RIC family)